MTSDSERFGDPRISGEGFRVNRPLCRCVGSDRCTPCVEFATQEDGFCDLCREDPCDNYFEEMVGFMEQQGDPNLRRIATNMRARAARFQANR